MTCHIKASYPSIVTLPEVDSTEKVISSSFNETAIPLPVIPNVFVLSPMPWYSSTLLLASTALMEIVFFTIPPLDST